jgi:hypothetical protein
MSGSDTSSSGTSRTVVSSVRAHRVCCKALSCLSVSDDDLRRRRKDKICGDLLDAVSHLSLHSAALSLGSKANYRSHQRGDE